MRFLRTHGWLLAVAGIACAVMLWRLDAQPYVNFDEAIHGEVSLEMVEHGDWLSPSYTEGPYFRKPPLKIWMTAGLFRVLPTPSSSPSLWEGENQRGQDPRSTWEGAEVNQSNSLSAWNREGEKGIVWAVRLPNAIAGVLVIILTAWWMWEWKRSRKAALLAGMVIATLPAIFEHAFRTGEMDGLLTLFVTAALYCWWKATCQPTPSSSPSQREGEKRKWLLLCGVAIGLAVMTKSAAGLLPLPIIALHWLLYRNTIRIPPRSILWASMAFTIIVAPWHIAMSILHGAAFWNEYLGFHVIARITTQLHNEGAGLFWYIGAFRRLAGPWFLWIIAALLTVSAAWTVRVLRWFIIEQSPIAPLLAWMRRVSPPTHHVMHSLEQRFRWPTLDLLLIWFAVTFIGYSIVQTKFAWYLLPLFPAVTLLIAWMAHAAQQRRAFRPMIAVLVALTVGAADAQTLRRIQMQYPTSPSVAIASQLEREQANGLVAYGFAWQEQPAAYFTLRTTLPQVRISDGLADTARTIAKLNDKERSWLITHATTELPQELRARTNNTLRVQDFLLYRIGLLDARSP